MKMNVYANRFSVVAGLGLMAYSAGAASPVPTVIYDNSVTPLNSYFASQTEFGDQITPPGGGWSIDTFTFEYYGAGLSGGETAKLRIYANDGAAFGGGKKPSTLLYESPSFGIYNGNFPVTVTDLAQYNILLPKTFTWTVTPTGVAGSETFGLKLYDPPVVGQSYNDIWQVSGGNWQLVQILGKVANFGAQLIAVPEPGTLTLLGVGAGLLFLRRRQA